MSKPTPLYEQHCLAKAKLVDFYGWKLPLHYGSSIKEHLAVRSNAGMFDVSHMTVVDLIGAGGRQLLRHLLSNDVDRLKKMGQALYSCMLNEHGCIIDDLIVYMRSSDNYRLVLNAANRSKDLAWIRNQANGLVGLQERMDLAMIAVQGPNALAKTLEVIDPKIADLVSQLNPFECAEQKDWFIARTGYTGEDGLEIIIPKEKATFLWATLLKADIQPCGLAARDSLRLEAGLMLCGQDMDENTTPLESALDWTVAWEPTDRDFIGRGSLESQRQHGLKRKLVGLVSECKAVFRAEQKVIVPEVGEGVITSGTFSPTLQKPVALARVPMDTADTCFVEIRGKKIPARVVKPRFVKQGKSLL